MYVATVECRVAVKIYTRYMPPKFAREGGRKVWFSEKAGATVQHSLHLRPCLIETEKAVPRKCVLGRFCVHDERILYLIEFCRVSSAGVEV